ncbi:MAG: hypothetical protein Q8N79_02490 [Candidatus Methanoperedens sp.]|nr:hypothetical protein [Candidatus Methanoperedens sp.]
MTRTLTASTAKIFSEKIKAEAEVRGNTTRVTFEYEFFLNETEDDAIIIGVEEKLSALTVEKILNVLGVDIKEMKVETGGRKMDDRPEVETTDNSQDDKRGQPEKRNSREDDS